MAADTRIFVSYRREESRHAAGRVAERIAERIGIDHVFIDVEAIEPGVDFMDAITTALASCTELLALIGPQWLTAVDRRGRRRIDDPEDIVAFEIEAALQREVPVVPVLLDGAEMPSRDDLPAPLRPLGRRQAVRIYYDTFTSDVDRLLDAITGAGRSPRSMPWQAALVGRSRMRRTFRIQLSHETHVVELVTDFRDCKVLVDGQQKGRDVSPWTEPISFPLSDGPAVRSAKFVPPHHGLGRAVVKASLTGVSWGAYNPIGHFSLTVDDSTLYSC